MSHPPQHAVSQIAGETCCDEQTRLQHTKSLTNCLYPFSSPSLLTRWLDSSVETMALMRVNVVTMPVRSAQLPLGHAVFHGIFLKKVSVEVQEARCTHHTTLLFPLGERGTFPLSARTPH